MVKGISIFQIMGHGMMTKVYTWSLFTRLFHLLLVIAVALVYLVSEKDSLLSYHVVLGYFIGLLLVYRIIWGLMDVKYSKFKDFNFNLKDLFSYMLNVLGNKKEYLGHNPASSWAIVAMIVLGLLSVISGVIVYGTQEGMGILSFLNISLFKEMDFFEDLHEFLANAFIATAFIHIAGVLIDRVFHKSQAIDSMIYGYKDGDENQDVQLTILQKLFGVVWIASSLLLLIYLLSTPSSLLIADANKAVEYKVENPLFYEECKSCHTLYPPFLLPKHAWVKMMDNLEEHFGDDASLEPEDRDFIKNYLVQNSAESSTKESAYKILQSIKKTDTLSITKTPYWKKRHADIDKKIFKSQKVTKVSNCKACHINIEKGLLNDKDINIPK